jgi:hypothetical protein
MQAAEPLKRASEVSVEITEVVTTDDWKGSLSTLSGRRHTVEVSTQGANFEALHKHIFNLKNWARGIHHRISRDHLQSCLDEFKFRHNNRSQRGMHAPHVRTTLAMSSNILYSQPWRHNPLIQFDEFK